MPSSCHDLTLAAATPSSIDALEHELTTLAAHLNAGNYRFLELLAEFDRRGGHVGWGIVSCAHWLQWKCGIGLVAAREKVRVARALTGLPRISDAMRRGVLSYCKVRALTRIATVENEDYLVELGEIGTVSHVEKVVRLYRRTDRGKELDAANDARADRGLRCYVDESGVVVVQGRLDPEAGALVMKALQAAGDALRETERASREACAAEPDAAKQPYPARMADALGLLAETFLEKGAAPLAAGDRHLVTVHIDERVLRDESEEGRNHVQDGASLPPATVRRLCCDGSLLAILERADGTVLDVGRKTRAIPPALRRALDARDRGCRFPGCSNTRFVDGHHIEHWVDGGETKLTNLVTLCRRHHRFVHEYGFRIEGGVDELKFVRPDGRVVQSVPASPGVSATEGTRALTDAHERSGLTIGARTGVPKWFGERIDYGEAVGALQDRAAARTRRAAADAH
jgi:hypothetical protein